MSFTVDVDVAVPMRDGTTLATDIWRPVGADVVPVLLVRSPYGKSAGAGTMIYGNPNILALLAAGYAVAMQDCRGMAASGGTFVPHVNEASDGADTVTWLTDQPWCDGNVGMYGWSYLGFVQWQAAATGVPGLKALAPADTSADFYRAPWYSPGGALSLDTLIGWTTRQSMSMLQRDLAEGRGDPADVRALAATLADPATMWSTPVAEQPVLAKFLPWIEDVVSHPARDEYWRDLTAIEECATITAPALNIGGWYDLFINETLRAYTRMRRHGGGAQAREGQRLIIGPWTHRRMEGVFPDRQFGMASSVEAAQLTDALVPFFDRWLRGRENTLDGVAPVRIFVMGIDQWRQEQDWPLPDTAYTDYHLDGAGRANTADGDGVLTQSAAQATARDTFLYDPRRPVPSIGGVSSNFGSFDGPADQRPVESRDDVLVFSTPVLTEPVEVTGPVTLTLFVSSTAVDTDFTGKLVDVHPDGRAIILCEGIQRMRYRDSLAEATFMTPGEIYKITIDLTATSNVFLPGHRIRLEVSSSNFPRYDRNSNTGGVIATEPERDMATAVNHVYHGANHPSRLTLPLILRR